MTRVNTGIAGMVILAALLCSAYAGPPIIVVPTVDEDVPRTPVTPGFEGLDKEALDRLPQNEAVIDCPVDVEFVLDASGSISGAEWTSIKNGVNSYVQTLDLRLFLVSECLIHVFRVCPALTVTMLPSGFLEASLTTSQSPRAPTLASRRLEVRRTAMETFSLPPASGDFTCRHRERPQEPTRT